MNNVETMALREDIKHVKDLLLDNLFIMKNDIMKHTDLSTKVILSSSNQEDKLTKLVCIKSCTKGMNGLGDLKSPVKEIGDIFDINTQDKMQLETDTMILTIPQDTNLKYIVGQEAYIVEFVTNYMGYLLPIIYEHYHPVEEDSDNQLHCKSVVSEV